MQPIEEVVGADAGAGVSMDDDDDDGDEGDRAAATAAGDLDASGDGKVGKRDGDDDADSDARASAAAADAGAGEGKKADDDGGADGGGARAAATAADDLDASGDGNVGKRDGDDDAGGDRKEDPDWVRTGVGSSVFLRRGPGPVVEFDAEKVQFWTGYSYKYQEVLLNDKYDHSSLLSPGVGRPTSSGRAEGNSKTHTKHSKPPQLGDPDRPQGWGGWICRKYMLIASPYAETPPSPQIRPPLVQTNHLNVCENAQIA